MWLPLADVITTSNRCSRLGDEGVNSGQSREEKKNKKKKTQELVGNTGNSSWLLTSSSRCIGWSCSSFNREKNIKPRKLRPGLFRTEKKNSVAMLARSRLCTRNSSRIAA